jgi:type III restriction enzyme
LIKKLREQENSVDIISGKGRGIHGSPENIIVDELMNYPEIDYDEQSDLLFKLTRQAIEKGGYPFHWPYRQSSASSCCL